MDNQFHGFNCTMSVYRDLIEPVLWRNYKISIIDSYRVLGDDDSLVLIVSCEDEKWNMFKERFDALIW